MGGRVVVLVMLVGLLVATSSVSAAAQEPTGLGVIRDDNRWLLRDSPTGGPAVTSFRYGRSIDGAHMLCDWNGDGRDGIGFYEGQRSPRWVLRDSASAGAPDRVVRYGAEGDQGLVW